MSSDHGTRGPRPSGLTTGAKAPVDQQRILTLARAWVGTPYQHQASLKGVGCDCLGFVRGVYAEACGRAAEAPPSYSRDWAEAARRETLIEAAERHMVCLPLNHAEPGDVLIFRLRLGAMAKHCAILTELQTKQTGFLDSIRTGRNVIPDLDEGRCSIGGTRSCRIESPMPLTRQFAPPSPHERGHSTTTFSSRASGKMIHAMEGVGVCEVSVTPWWRRRIAAVFRFP
jgi:NlpC/P60 family putative phage cell wall peptidase